MPKRTTDDTREERIAETFVDLVDTLVPEFDVIELLHTVAERSVELLDVDAAGIMLGDQRGLVGLHHAHGGDSDSSPKPSPCAAR